MLVAGPVTLLRLYVRRFMIPRHLELDDYLIAISLVPLQVY
jgi:hypothetical protein